jgi:peroxiredoxin
LNKLREQDTGKEIEIITINVGHNDSEGKIRKFVKMTGLKYPIIYDKKAEITKKYKVFGVPTVIIADTGGSIVFRQYYVPKAKEIKELLP